jgi:hypothetical protein
MDSFLIRHPFQHTGDCLLKAIATGRPDCTDACQRDRQVRAELLAQLAGLKAHIVPEVYWPARAFLEKRAGPELLVLVNHLPAPLVQAHPLLAMIAGMPQPTDIYDLHDPILREIRLILEGAEDDRLRAAAAPRSDP